MAIDFDPGDSDDPAFEIVVGESGQAGRFSVPADRAFLNCLGRFFAENRTNGYYNKRRLLDIGPHGLLEIDQPFYAVDLQCEINGTLHLWSDPCGVGAPVISTWSPHKVHVVLAHGECPGTDEVSFLVQTEFGLTGWTNTSIGHLETPGEPLACIVYHGD